ncbi:MAG: tetratricopeptide repeat protein [Verrucomicrobiia bacterium]
MSRFPGFSLLALGLLVGWSFWAEAQEAGTAEATVNAGVSAFNRGDFAAAEKAFSDFLRDFGANPQAQPYLERVMSLLAFSQVRQRKFTEAVESTTAFLKKFPESTSAEELTFWQGFALFRMDPPDLGRAIAALDGFVTKYPKSGKVPEALMAKGTALMQQEKWKEAAGLFQELAAQGPSRVKGKAQILAFFALVEAGDMDGAASFGAGIDPRSPDFHSVAAYSLLHLRLGDELANAERDRDALRVLQRVWPRGRVVAWQNDRLSALRTRLERVKTTKPDEAMELEDQIGQVERELAQLEKMADYDTALQMRIAQAFIRLERHREAALVLAEAKAKLPESKLLEQANFQYLICLQEMGHYPLLVSQATEFMERYPKSEQVPWALYLRAEAYQRLQRWDLAHDDFKKLVEQHRTFPQRERAAFLVGYSLMMQDRNAEAIAVLGRHDQEFPSGQMRETAAYWAAMAHYFDKNYELARAAFAQFLKAYPNSGMTSDVLYRKAHSLAAQQNFLEAYKELEAFVAAHPHSERIDEAYSLLGDSYFALGEIDRGIEAYRKVTKNNPRVYDYAYFRIADAYRALEEWEAMEKHLQAFISNSPESPKLVEALRRLGQLLRRDGKDEEAREIYWKAIEAHGDDTERFAVEDMLVGLGRMYRGEERSELVAKLGDLAEKAERDRKPLLAARALWARASILRGENPDQANRWLLRAAELVTPDRATPNLLSDFGDAARATGQREKAERMYRGLIAWYPRSMQRDRAYAGLGLLALEEGKEQAAMDWFERFERESIQSPLRKDVLRARADLFLKRGDKTRAVEQLEEILKLQNARGLPWVEALYQIGEIHLAAGDPGRAIPYFQRIYVMYGRWADYVSKAYLQSGLAFEKLNMRDEARRTYEEFVQNTTLHEKPEYPKIRERLQALGVGGQG